MFRFANSLILVKMVWRGHSSCLHSDICIALLYFTKSNTFRKPWSKRGAFRHARDIYGACLVEWSILFTFSFFLVFSYTTLCILRPRQVYITHVFSWYIWICCLVNNHVSSRKSTNAKSNTSGIYGEYSPGC